MCPQHASVTRRSHPNTGVPTVLALRRRGSVFFSPPPVRLARRETRGAAAGRAVQDKMWDKVYTSPAGLHESSINSISFAPHELGLHLACASSDGSVSVISHVQGGGCVSPALTRASRPPQS
jgi:hypothetical protein